MITLFDIPSTVGTWSPNVWRTRYTLDYKKIPYKVEWVEYPDLPTTLSSHGIGPGGRKPDGSSYYSVPSILDIDDATGETKKALSDSIEIAKYLDEAYPDTPKVLPQDTTDLEGVVAFAGGFIMTWLPAFMIICRAMLPKLHPTSREFFRKVRAKDAQRFYPGYETLEDIPFSNDDKEAAWKRFKESWIKNLAAHENLAQGKWFLGEGRVGFADFVIGGVLLWFKTMFGEDSEEWKDVAQWEGGKWAIFVEGLKDYQKA
ncbi:hypothetical protein MD484_g7806, partial [Candolleomyces efflorescens]